MSARRPAWWQELPLVAFHVVVVLGFSRVYAGSSYLLPLLTVVATAHVGAIACRRLGAPGWVAALVALVGGAVVLSAVLLGETTTWGLPTGATWTAAGDALVDARERFRVVIAPTEVTVGFQLASAVALWAAVWFADTVAWRLGGLVEALGPGASVFGFCAVLGDGDHGIALAAALAAAALAHVGAARVAAAAGSAASGPAARPMRGALARATAAMAVVAVLGGVVLGPRLPGADAEAAVGWRAGRTGDGPRVTVSPLVEINARLVEQSDLQVFEVRSPRRAYWRLTALEQFDGEIWSSTGEFSEASGDLGSQPASIAADTFTQRFQIDALSTIWVPAAYEAVAVRSDDEDLRWDDESGTLIVEAARTTSDGLTYEVESRAPDLSPAVLGQARGEDPRDLEAVYEELPDDFPAQARRLAAEVTAGADTRYGQARALQDWFRTEFTYSLDVAPGHGDDAVVDFLEAREGYCEQFAGTYAAMARSLGIPARVAVGFTPGEVDDDDPGRFSVRGRNAHAWPELWFPQVGWVPFEPTPGRGIPGGERYTGVPEQQEGDAATTPTPTSAPEPTTTTAPPAQDPEASPTTAAAPDGSETVAGAPRDAEGGDDGPGPWPWVAGAGVLAIAGGAAWWRRRSLPGRGATSPVDARWREVVAHLERVTGVAPRPEETAVEHAARVAPVLAAHDPDRAAALDRLAQLVTAARWSPTPLSPDEEDLVEALARQLLTTRAPAAVGAS